MKKSLIILPILIILLCGCVSQRPVADPRITPVITLPPTPPPTPAPTPSPTPEPLGGTDKLGNQISGTDHFKQYITLADIQVYEYDGDTFVDAVAISAYPEPINCALNITFFSQQKDELASGRFQTGDGQFMLVLNQGENRIFAQIDTDTTLLKLDFEIKFNESVTVGPVAVAD